MYKIAAMPLKIIDHGSKEYEQMVQLRNEVLRRPLGLTLQPEELASEKDHVLIAAYDDGDLLGCCMLVKEPEKQIRLRQMAVRNNLQGKGIGKSIVNFAENVARDLGYKKIIMNSRDSSTPFFEKLGYRICSEPFEKISLQYYRLEKAL